MDKVEDIVKRLRGIAISKEHSDFDCGRKPPLYGRETEIEWEAADLIQSQQALIEEMREALEGLLAAVDHLDIREGVCCCGDAMDTHSEPMMCGHSPVDAGEYYHSQSIDAARASLSKALSQKE